MKYLWSEEKTIILPYILMEWELIRCLDTFSTF
jgi:hypothetical protein